MTDTTPNPNPNPPQAGQAHQAAIQDLRVRLRLNMHTRPATQSEENALEANQSS